MTNLSTLRKSLALQIIIAMLSGMLVGIFFGSSTSTLGIIGKLVIQLIKAIAIPLVFFSIFEALISTEISWRHASRLFVVIGLNSLMAAGIGLSLSNLIEPGKSLSLERGDSIITKDSLLSEYADKKISFIDTLTSHLPNNILEPFTEGDIMGVVLIALLLGAACRKIRSQNTFLDISKKIELLAIFAIKIFEQILSWLILLIPLAVFGVTAKTVGEYGFAPFSGLALYVVIALIGMLMHISIVYQIWILLFAKISLSKFWLHAKAPITYAIGTNSSLATLPLTLKALDQLEVSKPASRLGCCVATNFNNDGIILYEAMAVLFVAQVYGIDISFMQQLSIVALCLIAACGVAGVPEAGVISLSLVLSTTQLPTEILPLLLTVDWVVARARSVTNVLSDMTVSIALDAWDKRATKVTL